MKGAFRALRNASVFFNHVFIVVLLSVFYVACIGFSALIFWIRQLFRGRSSEASFWARSDETVPDPGSMESAY